MSFITMAQEGKELLFKDLTARLPYGVSVYIRYKTGEPCYGKLTPKDIQWFIDSKIETIKPYLRSLSSMTEEERKEYTSLCNRQDIDTPTWSKIIWHDTYKSIDWLNKKMFDYRGLIEKGLAIAVTEKNNHYKE